MILNPPQRNLSPESTRWGVWVEQQFQEYVNQAERSGQTESMANAAQTATLEALAEQIQSLESTVTSLNDTIAYLDGLTTVSATGANFNTGNTPGDSTFRWSGSSPALTLQTQCPTGKLLVTLGTGECTLFGGDSSAVAAISFSASTPSGWAYALDSIDSRLFLGNGMTLGVPLVVNAPLTGVPTNEVVTIAVQYGIWSSSATTLASANFQSNYVIAQVTG